MLCRRITIIMLRTSLGVRRGCEVRRCWGGRFHKGSLWYCKDEKMCVSYLIRCTHGIENFGCSKIGSETLSTRLEFDEKTKSKERQTDYTAESFYFLNRK